MRSRFHCVRIISCLLVSLSLSTTATGDGIEYSSIPDWVVDRSSKSVASSERSEDHEPFSMIVDEIQTRQVPTDTDSFFRWKMVAYTVGAIPQISTISFAYVPAFQTYEIHYVRVHRDGKVIDMRDNVQLRFLRQDAASIDNLDELLTQASLFVGDVQVNDAVEVAISVSGSNKTFEGVLQGIDSYGGRDVRNYYRRLLVPKNTDLKIKRHGEYPVASVHSGRHWDEYEWVINDVAALEIEYKNPVWYVPVPMIEYTNQNGWGDVAAWAAGNFQVEDSQLEAVAAMAHTLAADRSDIDEKVSAALDFVQSKVRYVGPGIGRNGFRPDHPSTVLERRYGDCKDKATLLTALLAQMGIKSWPALVSSAGPKMLDVELPSSMAFDHVIVLVQSDDSEYWLDPTELPTGDGNVSLANVYQFDKALVLREGEGGLTKIPRPPITESNDYIRYRTEIDLTGSLDDPHEVMLHSDYLGSRADSLRSARHNYGQKQFAEFIREDDTRILNSAEDLAIASLTEHDEGDGIALKSSYLVSDLTKSYREYPERKLKFAAYRIRRSIEVPKSEARTTPYALPYPLRVDETVVLKIGDNMLRTIPIDYKIDTPHFAFLGEGRLQDQEFIINYSLQMKTDHVAAEDYGAYRENAKRLKTETGINVFVADMQWPEPEVAWDDLDSEISLDSAVDFFNRENDELGIGIGRPPLTSDDVILAITELDRSFLPMSDSIYELLELIRVR